MEKTSNSRKIVESLFMYSACVALGVAASILGPTLLDLQELTHSTTSEISVVLMIKCVGGLLGATISGVLISRMNPWLIMSCALGLSGTMEILKPLCTNLPQLTVVMTFGTMFAIIYDSSQNMQLIKIWEEKHESWMQALHCVFGVGTLLGPLIAAPFLSETSQITLTNTTTESPPSTNVRFAYFIDGGFLFLNCVLIFTLYLTGERFCCLKRKTNLDQQNSKPKDKKSSKTFLVTFLILQFVYCWLYCALEITYGTYLTTYTVEELGWSKVSGATLTSVFWATFTFGRGVGIIVVKYVSTVKLLFSMTFLAIIVLIPEVFFAYIHVSMVWVTTVFFGLCLSSLYASELTFANVYINLTGGLGGVLVAAGSFGELTGPAVVSPFFDTYGMKVFTVLNFVTAILLFIVLIFSLVIGKKCGVKRNHKTNETTPLLKPETSI